MNKEVFIFGTSALAAEITEYINDNNANKEHEEKIKILGYFDVDDANYKKYSFKEPFLGEEKDYVFKNTDLILVAITNIQVRMRIFKFIQINKLKLFTFIHHSCFISINSNIDDGNILCPNVIVGPNVNIGKFNIVNYKASIPHDCNIGFNNILSPNVQFTGNVSVGDNNFFGTSCTILPNIIIGNDNQFQASLLIDKSINNNLLIMANIKKIKISLNEEKD